ncbi:hypothetical protein [Algisphaera agarilytica]|uniref:EVE domain-containing protein n=1 Tax=Algisphaera agarilytica TaxID=1385975 RepID=A0A7X0H4G3_9BACT|nr:hypothetical protein [Algisphaera agarilytica]MBB6429101.1 hypothetical protein [Algisphaera agarilytica]
MPLFRLDSDQLTTLPVTNFAQEGVSERYDLQRLLREQIDVLLPDALVLTDEFADWDDSRRRIDLLALDTEARLVVIELKRTTNDGQLDLQAIRYAAMASTMTFDQAVAAYAKYSGSTSTEAEQVLLDFLDWDGPQEEFFGQEVRIVLVAPDFHKEVTTSVIWLNQRDLDITCVRIRPHRQGDELILDVQRIIPLPEAGDFLVRAKDKSRGVRRATRGGGWIDGEGYWFVNVGESPTNSRCWEDCQRYGFMQAGGGPKWIRQISRLQPGDKIMAYLSRHGYVGVGEVVSEAVMQRDFVSPVKSKRLLELPLEKAPMKEHLHDPDRCDWCIGVNWVAVVPREEALRLKARRQTVCKLHDHALVEGILSHFTPPEVIHGSTPKRP